MESGRGANAALRVSTRALPSRRRCGGWRSGDLLGAPLDVGELARLHHPVFRLDEQEADEALKPSRLKMPVAALDHPGAAARQLLQCPAPRRVGVQARPPPARIEALAPQIAREAEYEQALVLADCDLPPDASVWRGVEVVPDGDLLPLRMDPWELWRPKLSSRSQLYQPARSTPIWTSQGHTAEGGASIVTAFVALRVPWSMMSAPGNGRRSSSSVAPQRSSLGRTTST
jgi:hypothetical protein